MSKRKASTIEEKYEIIKRIENKVSTQQQISEETGIPRSTITRWCNSEKEKMIVAIEQSQTTSTRKRTSKSENVDESLYSWFKDQRAHNIPINGPILMAKAYDFAALHNEKDFKSTNGWLDRWKNRFNITFQKMSGESAKVDEETCKEWLNKLKHIIVGYEPEDIYNADETGLFFKCLPDKTFNIRGNKCFNGEKSKERLTLLFCCNSTGTHKMVPLVIGKSAKPRCLARVNMSNLGVYYRNNTKAWMTEVIFREWLLKIDKSLKVLQLHDLESKLNDYNTKQGIITDYFK